MLGSPHRRSRSGLAFAAFTVVSLLLLLTSQTAPAVALQGAATRALDPLRSTLSGAGAAVGEIDRLRTENDQLRRELAAAEQRLAELR